MQSESGIALGQFGNKKEKTVRMEIRDTEQANHSADIASFWMKHSTSAKNMAANIHPVSSDKGSLERKAPKWKLRLGFLYVCSGIY